MTVSVNQRATGEEQLRGRPDDSCTEELPEVRIVPDLPGWAEPRSQGGEAP